MYTCPTIVLTVYYTFFHVYLNLDKKHYKFSGIFLIFESVIEGIAFRSHSVNININKQGTLAKARITVPGAIVEVENLASKQGICSYQSFIYDLRRAPHGSHEV